jgi:hypothetical protein
MRSFQRKPQGRGGLLGNARVRAAALVVMVATATLVVVNTGATPSSFVELEPNSNVIFNGIGTYDWANSGALSTTGNTYSRAGSGGIFNGGHFIDDTTPPTAPALTPTAAADTSIAAAKFKVDPLAGDKTSCGTGDPTVYTGKSSETNGDLLSSDTFGTSTVPQKDDLSNVYAIAHINGATNEVFFGAERVVNNGDSHIDFEFMQGTVTIPAACSGSFSGNRTEGDFLLSVDFTNGGTLGGTTLYQWHCNADPGPQPADGTVCNPGKQLAPHYEKTGSSAITINVNGGSDVGCGGWVCRNADGSPTTMILKNELMEGGIDLAQLGFTGCVSTFLPHTRSSQTFNAVLKDFEIIPFNTCRHPTVATTIVDQAGSPITNPVPIGTTVHDTATITGGTADAGGTISYSVFRTTDCSGTAVNLGTKTVTNGIAPPSNTFTPTQAGKYYFYAVYSGDGRNIGPVNSGCSSELLTVKTNPTVATTIVDQAGSPITNPVPLGTTVHDTATITGATANAGGTITYSMFRTTDCSGTKVNLGTKTVTNGIAPPSNAITVNQAGDYYFYAVYSGDTNNTGNNSGCSKELLTVSPNAPAPHSRPVAQIKDTLTVTGLTALATGNVVVGLYSSKVNGVCTTQVGNNATFAASPNVGGTLSAQTSFVVVTSGTYYYKISYAGDNNNTGFSSCDESVAVTITSLP